MKKASSALFAIFLILILTAGCSINGGENGNDNGSGEADLITTEGYYIGLADTNSMEVLVDGEPVIFRKAGLVDIVEDMKLTEDEKIRIDYIQTEDEKTVQEIEILEVEASTGIFVGFEDNNSFEMIDEEQGFKMMYAEGVYDELSDKEINTGDLIKVFYQIIDDQNRMDRFVLVENTSQDVQLETATLTLNGIIDNNSFEATAASETLVLRYYNTPEKFDELGIEDKDEINATWYENNAGQLIAVWLEK
ncbi:hypothetical protein [Alkalibacter saccharofermentans]|uniref:Uncharacterized protein n=1 Tax=Alkalibacter saccharofermentans DSM 14828 TaxID=1120975 RepID=A0A1M4SQP7_9FIRM|nr:hypothetical protein [Alkalibacter saccharofermentans]SHE34277.1 hypothetical protein SAMN02746064_00336 [Alkalibacter saccharofermentans DSM 14828]